MSKKQLLEEKIISLHSLWWEAMRLGDKEAFLDIYKSLYRSLGGFGLRIYSDPDVVTDSLNQVFLDIWEKHEFLPRVENVEAYLRRTLKNKILKNIARQQKMDNAIAMISQDDELLDMPYEELVVKIESDELVKRQLDIALKKLTPQQRKLIQLRFYEGLSYENVAENSGLTVRTAYNTIYSALKSLREHLRF
ncbi:RNA polymerase sigma factor, sigma-70 family [Pedobacter steynii]|uniref:RNA polymerase sigma factor, sigma-70 family n=1 Tax=Pedobacter steynii TaxID=430522 RepID=A0A1H0CMW6_9SPHI|nr:sigma-70 family RNA polymerase sigma factor [Pedobacter steynii]SDN59101.1 RNA polymerase sigma factor, sigma-70 family [Pedobacter steynii]